MSDLSPPPPPPPLLPTPPPGEQVQATIPGIMRTAGFLGVNSRLHTLVITNQRLIFARLTGAELKRVVKGLSEGAKAEGKDWKGRMRERAGAYQALADECAAMTPDDLLAQHPKNFAVDRATITKVRLRTVDRSEAGPEDRLTITTTGKKYKLVLTVTSLKRTAKILAKARLL